MTNTLRFALLAASLLGSAVTPVAWSSDVAASREHRTTLDAYRAAHVRAYLDARPDGIASYQAEALRLMPAYQKTVLGKASAAIYHRAFLKRFDVSALDRQPIEVADLGQQILEIGQFTMAISPKGSNETRTLAGKYMDLWSKSAGKLELITAAWNYDQWPKDAEEFRFADVPSVHIALQARVPVAAGVSLELAALQKLQETAILQHDGRTWALFYADDAILFANHSPAVSGRKALDEYTIEHAKSLPVFEKLDLRTYRIDDLGEYAVEYASAVVNWRIDQNSGVNLGKNIIVWRRGKSGALQIWRAIAMYD